MKIVTIPETVEMKGVDGDPLTFKKWLMRHLDFCETIKTPSQIRQASKIAGIIEDANGTMALEDEHYEILKGCVQAGKFAPIIARQLTAYLDALDKAEEVKKT